MFTLSRMKKKDSKKNTFDDIGKPYVSHSVAKSPAANSSAPNGMSSSSRGPANGVAAPTAIPRIPRATGGSNWDNRTNLEMAPSSSRQNLISSGRNGVSVHVWVWNSSLMSIASKPSQWILFAFLRCSGLMTTKMKRSNLASLDPRPVNTSRLDLSRTLTARVHPSTRMLRDKATPTRTSCQMMTDIPDNPKCWLFPGFNLGHSYYFS